MGSSRDGYYEELDKERTKRWEKEAEKLGLPLDLAQDLSGLLAEVSRLEDKVPYSTFKKIVPFLQRLDKYKARI